MRNGESGLTAHNSVDAAAVYAYSGQVARAICGLRRRSYLPEIAVLTKLVNGNHQPCRTWDAMLR
jgi:diketogulonate reductase-like aldo/keto reductase